MIVCPNAKINLGLRIKNKRPDSYHNLSGFFIPVDFNDVLEIVRTDEQTQIKISGIKVAGKAENNLCIKAYNLLKSDYKFGNVKIHLHKQIPTGAGLGGGSSDASATLVLLNRIFELDIDKEKLKEYAAKIGADCSFFIENSYSHVSGIGEKIYPVDDFLKGYYLKLYKPDFNISTAEAYSGVKISGENILKDDYKNIKREEFKDYFKNDFEDHLFKKYPVLNEIKNENYKSGAFYSSMTGSGSAIYGIYNQKPLSKTEFEDLLIWEGEL